MVRVGLGLGLGVGLGASLLLIAECRYAIRGDQVPIVGTRYTIFFNTCSGWRTSEIHSLANIPIGPI